MSKIWATPVWFFFHGMAEKVHEDFYNKNKQACLNIIKQICYSLPCPMCKNAATKFMNRITIKHIPTKKHFKMLLFNFHNHVNRKLRKRKFNYEQLEKYKYLRFIKCTKIMCAQLRRFNNKGFMRSSNSYINLVENSIRHHIKYFI